MDYIPLKKLYYSDPDLYIKTYQARFSSPEAVHLSIPIARSPAFFLKNAEVYRLAYRIATLNTEVTKLRSLLPPVALNQYSRRCLIDEIVLTNRIEGIHSSRKEIGEALDVLEHRSGSPRKHIRFLGIVRKYVRLLNGDAPPLASCTDIRALYDELVLPEVLEEDPKNRPDGKIFRKELSEVHDSADHVIHKGLFPEEIIIEAMDHALLFLHDENTEPLLRCCVFHYLLEYIHPFYDGNGRLGRFILSNCLSSQLDPLIAYRISGTIKEYEKEYHTAFDLCNDHRNLGDITPFLIMSLEMILRSLEHLVDSLSKKYQRWRSFEDLANGFPESRSPDIAKLYSFLIQSALFSERGISTTELCTLMDVSYNTLRKLLAKIPEERLSCSLHNRTNHYSIRLETLDALLFPANP